MSLFKGCATALVTPFKESGEVNCDALSELIDYQLEGNVSALVMCGTTGESATLSDQENEEIVSFTVSHVKGKVPVIAGAGSNNTEHAVKLAKNAQKAGADGLLVVTPYYNKTSARGLTEHFTSIADSVDIPLVLYNVPSRTGMNIPLESYSVLGAHPNIAAVKEASGNMSYTIAAMDKSAGRLDFYSGNDDVTLPMMAVGALGVISVISNVAPSEVSDMCRLFFDGNINEASRISYKLLPLFKALFSEVNPIPVKETLNMLGFNVGKCRMPLFELDDKQKSVLYDIVSSYGYA